MKRLFWNVVAVTVLLLPAAVYLFLAYTNDEVPWIIMMVVGVGVGMLTEQGFYTVYGGRSRAKGS